MNSTKVEERSKKSIKEYSTSRYIVREESCGQFIYDKNEGKLAHFPEQTSQKAILKAPMRVYLDLISRCNLQCVHCIANSTPKTSDKDTLTFNQFKKLIDELIELQVFEVYIGGGEPLLRKDALPILAYIADKGINITLTTNGTLVTEEISKKISEIGVFQIKVSFDGLKKNHDKLRGKGMFEKAVNGIKLLRAYNPRVGMRVTATSSNLEDLEGIVQLAREERCNCVKIASLKPYGRAKNFPSLLMSKNDKKEFMKIAEGLCVPNGETKVIVSKQDVLLDSDNFYDGLKYPTSNCGVGVDFCHIEPCGTVKPCITLNKLKVGNVKNESFSQIWKTMATKINKIDIPSDCTLCKVKIPKSLFS